MRSKANVDIGKYVMEGMMTIFIVLIFLFIVQNWVVTKAEDTPFMPTCSLFDIGARIGRPVPCETNTIIDGYNIN